MCYRIAGIDVHKKMLAVVVADVEVTGEYQFERRQFASNPERLSTFLDYSLCGHDTSSAVFDLALLLELFFLTRIPDWKPNASSSTEMTSYKSPMRLTRYSRS
jgi:hypothetical protein